MPPLEGRLHEEAKRLRQKGWCFRKIGSDPGADEGNIRKRIKAVVILPHVLQTYHMAVTVIEAFNQFLQNSVNLAPGITKTARASRDWLIERIHDFEDNVDHFPLLYTEKDIAFGSFARNTKIRDLDDIDQMIAIKAQGATYFEYPTYIQITVPSSADPLHRYCSPNTHTLNSRILINQFVSALNEVPNYEKAEVKRTNEAVTLKLTSYTWNFDIVPCFFTSPESDGRTFYIIPDGNGTWKKTDPRRDRDIVMAVNQLHDGNVLNAIRVMKFWNKRLTAPAMPAYLLETLIIRYYLANTLSKASEFVDLEIPNLLNHIANSIFGNVYDLKDIQGNLNDLSFTDRLKIQQRANYDYGRAVQARKWESAGYGKTSIQQWGEIFGPSFPTYG